MAGRKMAVIIGASAIDRALAQASTSDLGQNILLHQIIFHDGERADTVRRFESWDQYRAAQKR